MRTITFRGPESIDAAIVGKYTFPRGEKVFVADEVKDELPLLDRRWFDNYETLMTDLVPYGGSLEAKCVPLDVTVIVPQYKTSYLVRRAVKGLTWRYPKLPVFVADDGSNDASTEYIQLLDRQGVVHAVISPVNIGHGPILDLAIQQVKTPCFFTMDSDCVVNRWGFLELMQERMVADGLYGIGILYHRDVCRGNMYLSCVASMYDTAMYRSLPPFVHSGDPMQQNMDEAARRGYKVEAFPIFDFIEHREAGTRAAHEHRWDLRNL